MSHRAPLAAWLALGLAGCQAETFSASGPTGIEVVQGAPDSVSLGTELDSLLLVRVVDAQGRPQAGVHFSWRVIDGDSELLPTDSVTGLDGLAEARWRFHLIPGLQRARFEVAGQDPMLFETQATAFRAIQVTAGYRFGCGLDAQHAAWCTSTTSSPPADSGAA